MLPITAILLSFLNWYFSPALPVAAQYLQTTNWCEHCPLSWETPNPSLTFLHISPLFCVYITHPLTRLATRSCCCTENRFVIQFLLILTVSGFQTAPSLTLHVLALTPHPSQAWSKSGEWFLRYLVDIHSDGQILASRRDVCLCKSQHIIILSWQIGGWRVIFIFLILLECKLSKKKNLTFLH